MLLVFWSCIFCVEEFSSQIFYTDFCICRISCLSQSKQLYDFLFLFSFCLVALLLPPAFTFSFCLPFSNFPFIFLWNGCSPSMLPSTQLPPRYLCLSLYLSLSPSFPLLLLLQGTGQVKAGTGGPVPVPSFPKGFPPLQGWLGTCPLLWSFLLSSAPAAGPQRTQICAVNNEASLPPVCSDYHFFFSSLPTHFLCLMSMWHHSSLSCTQPPITTGSWLSIFASQSWWFHFLHWNQCSSARSAALFLQISPVCFAFFLAFQHAYVNSINQATDKILNT